MITALKKIWKIWLKIGEFLGNIVGTITLYIFYYTLFLIPGIYFSILKDKIGKNYTDNDTYFQEATDIHIHTLNDARELA
jgi:hypothetical protein